MQCHIVSIGNELLIGDTVNTNASWLGETLAEVGVEVTHVHTIADEYDIMREVLESSLKRADLVITTGGLGPTHDDITKKVVADLCGCDLVVDREVLAFIKEVFKRRNIPFSKSNYHQAEVPECCEVLFNTQGTAPGMWFDCPEAKLVVLPGVPFEMKHLMNEKVLPKIRKINGKARFRYSHYLTTAGIGESTLSDEVIGDVDEVLSEGMQLAYLPSPQGARIRVSTYGTTQKEAEQRIASTIELIRKKAAPYIIGEGKDVTLPKVINELLNEHNLWLATAESCTGGYISNAITDVPGSSRFFKGGVNAYSNEVKIKQLGVQKDVIEQWGAVSKKVALQMAKGAAQQMNADIGISTTGVAGPGGGTKQKPVGTVWIGFWSKEQHFALKALFTNDRLLNKERSSAVALEIIRRSILDIDEMPYGLKKYQA